MNSVRGYANDKAFVKPEKKRQLSPLNTATEKEKGIFVTCLIYLTILQSNNLIG